MRWAAVAIALLFLVPSGAAARSYEHYYVAGVAPGCSGSSGTVVKLCVTYFPHYGDTNVTASVSDVSSQSVRIRICHEWTYDDGSHPTVRCAAGCSPTFGSALSFPPWTHNTTYRVIVDLRNGPAGCDVAATAGSMHVSFT